MAKIYKPRCLLLDGSCIFQLSSYLDIYGFTALLESQLEEPVVELPPLKVKDLPMNSGDPKIFYQLVTELANEVKTSDGVIFNTSEDLEEQESDKTFPSQFSQ